MKTLIIGGSGVIGSKFTKQFLSEEFELLSTYFDNKLKFPNECMLDIRDRNSVEKIFKKIDPDIVIHTSAITNIDLCETDHKLADSINVQGTKNIINYSKKFSSKLIYISTSFVFDGTKTKYFENDLTNPTTYYGKTKDISEKNIINSELDFLILRTDQPYCWIESGQHTNSVLRVIDSLKAKKHHKEIVDWYNTPTYVPDFVETAKKLIINEKSGIFHLVGSDYINRFEWSKIICDCFNLNKKFIKPITSQDLKLPARRSNVNLSNEKIFNEMGIRMMGIRDGLKSMLEEEKLEQNEKF